MTQNTALGRFGGHASGNIPHRNPNHEPAQTSFADLGIGKNFLAVLEHKEFVTPTPIQHQVIPAAIVGKDVVGIAQTGTGKTLAYGIPMIQRLAISKSQGLVLVPTRELALQVEAELLNVGRSLGLRTVVFIGGESQQKQVRALKNSPHIVIATPGRLVDLMDQRIYRLDRVSIAVLDEADRMLDVGFLPQIKRVLKEISSDRQTMLFSATMPGEIASLAAAFMKMPLRIEIAPQGTAAKNVEQEVFIVRKDDKMRLLDKILSMYGKESVLVFSRTKHGAKKMTRDIRNMGHTVAEIHSNKSLAQRKIALEGFKTGRFRVLVATDIAARGIDVKDIGLVLNFDLPDNSEDYVHRIGRTGRAGKFGKAISFATPAERIDIKKIERLIRKTLPVLSLPALPPERPRPAFVPEQGRERGRRGFGRPRAVHAFSTQRGSASGGRPDTEQGRAPRQGNSSSPRHSSRGFRSRGRGR